MKHQLAIAVLSVVLACAVTSARAQSGADLYKSRCAMCHGADGLGNTPMGKTMKIAPFDAKKSDADLIAVTAKGKGKMPAYSAKLTEPQIKDVVAYIRTLQK